MEAPSDFNFLGSLFFFSSLPTYLLFPSFFHYLWASHVHSLFIYIFLPNTYFWDSHVTYL